MTKTTVGHPHRPSGRDSPSPEPVKAPESTEDEKDICGPTVVVLLAILVLVFRHRGTPSSPLQKSPRSKTR